MDARFATAAAILCAFGSLGATHRTTNFTVTADSKAFAVEVAEAAEGFREELAVKWLGKKLPKWREPCPIRVHAGRKLGAGGATSFIFFRGKPAQWKMTIQGSKERILDSVLPHEITHTVFATHFGRPLPRWADEGACTTVEHSSERRIQHRFLVRFLNEERGIPFNRMFAIREYPRDVMPLYSQGYSVVKYLLYQGGHQKFTRFLGHGMKTENWDEAIDRFYGFEDLSDLQLSWVDWVKGGSPSQVASRTEPKAASSNSLASTGSSSRTPSTTSPISKVAATVLAELDRRESPTRDAEPAAPRDASEKNYYILQAQRASKAGATTTYRR